jgi:hypothetical protein
MADDRAKQAKDMKSRDIEAHRKGGNVAPEGSFAGADIAGDEEEQTRDRERAARGDHTDEIGELTETELDDGDSL